MLAEKRSCLYCGAIFQARARTSSFCSSKCYHSSTKGVKKTIKQPVVCLTCNKSFIPRKKTSRYCSPTCWTHSSELRQLINKSQVGRPMPEHVKAKLLQASLTRIKSPEERKKIGDAHRGPKNLNWRGGISIYRHQRAGELATWSKKVLTKYNKICQLCACTNTAPKGMQAHHIYPYAEYPAGRLDINNGLALCKVCHYFVHRNHAIA